MERNSVHPLGNLRKGDRFHFQSDKKKVVYQTTGTKLKQPYVGYTSNPERLNPPFHKTANGYEPVVFLRHTRAIAGQEVMLLELHEGDVFALLIGPLVEYRVVNLATQYKDTLIELVDQSQPPHDSCDMGVLFIRKAEEVAQ